MGKKINAKTATRLINEVIMVDDNRPEPSLTNNSHFVTLAGRLRGGTNWPVTTIIGMDEDSLSFSVQLPGGVAGYTADILNEFADEETVAKYACHALNLIYKRNGWKMAENVESD